jgi:hypothetical protein
MIRRVAQPPMNPEVRDVERHDFLPGLVVAVIAAVLVLCGARHLTGIETVDGGTAWETQLIKAYSSSGLKYPEVAPPPPPPPKLDDPAASAAALERWQRETASATPPPGWKVRVDTAAAAPCPT